ncbi:alcohol dehydrogenase-like regulatory protein ErcA [Propionivibrio dicarboxylicus]|uniref:Alcohol dehydrogenase, class IV n=1 Tax=Propionivibrio dicarboxylicus TaxID=83767 RepID=A0A1G8M7W5_9RHOO|nr:alcohol dehydrogenase-like regulatory protein ErcA [Propionivibrio dicarboxylicus]SDI63943.1 Alcohol dehydrogenase, class IV [Propionivibrio dicarboxylicus]
MALYEMRKFVAPEFIFGVGARHRVGFYARNMMARRVLVVCDAGVIAAGWLRELEEDLAAAGIESVVFQGLSPNPKDFEVMAGAALYAREHCDVIVALGGGSVIDCAKAIGVVHTNGCSVLQFEGVDQIEVPGPPLICIPTTAGTAADISQFCIIVNSTEHYKMAIISKTVVPDVALVDPETTRSMDPYLTACTGMDALTHAIEAYVSTACSPIVDVHALAAIRLVMGNLDGAVAAPGDLPARENMMLASLQAGLAFSNASLGAVHALAHSAGGFLDLPHGECNALLLEHVVRFNLPAAPERYRQIAEAMGVDTRGMEAKTIAARITQSITDLRRRVGISNGLGARGVRSADLSELARHAIRDACVVTNPRRVSRADVEVIYGDAL